MHANRSLARRASLVVTAAAATVVLAACGGGNDHSGATHNASSNTASASASVSANQYNQADVSFAQQMIPHHRQAVAMAGMAASHGASSEVKALAEKIEKAQDPEIETMSGWLKAWDAKVPDAMEGMPAMGGMDHGDHASMPGMMGQEDMDKLGGTIDKDFDRMFLTMMIEHHEGAVDMAKTEQQKGASPDAMSMAGDIVRAQTVEIAQMRQMLGTS
ncbi:DUF305 domain-containing protein [Actinacidiphila glaucinigra]|uniref:DUF305 domain-containing protein n=1 Tax=Actinacidiphila glaucinigra TaxID=235986 RepID=UPI003868E3CB